MHNLRGEDHLLSGSLLTLHRNASQTVGTNYDRPNRLKGREDTVIRWSDLLEKFRNVQERARRSQRFAPEVDDTQQIGLGDLRISEGFEAKGARDARNQGAPPVPMKDAAVPASQPSAAAAKQRSGLGRQLGRFGGAVSGRGKRP